MLSFFRRIINSRFGIVIAIAILGIFALSFGALDVSSAWKGTSGLSGDNVANVGGTKVGFADLRSRVGSEIDARRQQDPSFDLARFVGDGGIDAALDQLVTSIAFERFGADQGMVISKRSIDGQIASIPAFQGPNGKFDITAYQRLLAERKLTDAGVRIDLARGLMGQALSLPIAGATQVPLQVALPYASLLLERREGQVGTVPNSAATTGPAPTDADLAAFYARSRARYTVPERRAVRFALVTPDTVKARATPTEAEIAAAYRADTTRFAATERRDVEQVVALDQATAAGIAAKAKGGSSLADAARAAGLEASTQKAVTRTTYAAATAPAVADAVFTAAKGAVIGPVRSPLGYTVARVAAVQQVAARTLDQARGELSAEIGKRKLTEALIALHDQLDASVGKSATFDELVADGKLSAQVTPALLANGTDPLDPRFKAPPALPPVLAAAFQMEEGDDPQLVTTGQDGSFAVMTLGRVVRAAPRPLAEIRDQVAKDFAGDRAHKEARRMALALLARVNGDTPFGQALAAARLPAARPVAASRAQLAANPGGAPPALVLMFSMAQGTAKLLETPDGWLVVRLDRIVPTDAAGRPQVVSATRADLARTTSQEYLQQFARAVRADVGVKIDPAAVSRLKADLTGAGAGGGN